MTFLNHRFLVKKCGGASEGRLRDPVTPKLQTNYCKHSIWTARVSKLRFHAQDASALIARSHQW